MFESLRRIPSRSARRGTVLTLIAILLPLVVGLCAFAVDIGYVVYARTKLQVAADSAALAGACLLADGEGKAKKAAISYAELNVPKWGQVLTEENVTFGTWDAETRTFAKTNKAPNAVRVELFCGASNNNAVPSFFGKIFGVQSRDVSAVAIAVAPDNKPEFRFLLDSEMFDTDDPAIEQLAKDLGKKPDDLLQDANQDGFIDIPGGHQLTLSTGQVGDEALFDIKASSDKFPFQEDTLYSYTDLLAEGTSLESTLKTKNLQDVTWDAANAPHDKLIGSKVLDPVPGTDAMNSEGQIKKLPNPSHTYVSPVYKSDISITEKDPSKYGAPSSNLQGEKRGLVAFKILSSSTHPEKGSYLPLLTIEIVDPSTIDITSLGTGESAGDGLRIVH